jgi:hypothetical protein
MFLRLFETFCCHHLRLHPHFFPFFFSIGSFENVVPDHLTVTCTPPPLPPPLSTRQKVNNKRKKDPSSPVDDGLDSDAWTPEGVYDDEDDDGDANGGNTHVKKESNPKKKKKQKKMRTVHNSSVPKQLSNGKKRLVSKLPGSCKNMRCEVA